MPSTNVVLLLFRAKYHDVRTLNMEENLQILFSQRARIIVVLASLIFVCECKQ